MMQGEAPGIKAAVTPAANGNANPAISLSIVISFLFFAKVLIIFVTLQRCTGNKNKNPIK
jgi:hypothetical protein